ncbi:MAG: Xaa-Pro peptidase family protein [Candidatus Nezhaarchaeota archaeon]|nr:Xaa-Pro peptidase family protein [Candidatus Nezhaarchaeota archaeon]
MSYPVPRRGRSRRLKKLLKQLEKRGLDCFLASVPENIEYLTGFPAASYPPRTCYFLASVDGLAVLLVPKLDLEEAEELVGGSIEVRELRKSIREALEKLVRRERLGVEAGYLSHKAYLELEKWLGPGRLTDASGLVEELREVKEEVEVSLIRRAVEAAEKSILRGVEALINGVSERETAGVMEAEARKAGADGIAFDPIVSCSPRSSQPHRPAGGAKLVSGEPVVIDFGVKVEGYCSDISRTVVVGSPKPWVEDSIEAVLEAKRAAELLLKPGLQARSVDLETRYILRRRGLAKYFIHGVGHGLGLSVHEAPALSPKSRYRLRPRMVVTLEPGLYFRGQGGVRVEDVYLVAKDGPRRLSTLSEVMVL